MYNLINQNIDLILSGVNRNLDIDSYLSLMRRFSNVNVALDQVFQLDFRTYWRLNAVLLSANFCKVYFDLMENLRVNDNLDIEVVTRQLYEVPTHENGRQSLQFSFASKLIHTLDPHKPIYDSRVADFFFFQPPGPGKGLAFRLEAFLNFYSFLCREYERFLSKGILDLSISRFREAFDINETYTDEKVIDTLTWRFVALLRNGALRDGRILYS